MERSAVLARLDLGVGARGLSDRLCFHDRHGAKQRGVESLHAIEIDLRELRRRDLFRGDQRRETMRRKKRNRFRVARHRARPRLHHEFGALERRRTALTDQRLHQVTGTAGPWLKGPRHRLAIAEWREWSLRCGLRCAGDRAGRATLRQCARAKPESARRRTHEGEKYKLAARETGELLCLLTHQFGFGLHLVEQFKLVTHVHRRLRCSCVGCCVAGRSERLRGSAQKRSFSRIGRRRASCAVENRRRP